MARLLEPGGRLVLTDAAVVTGPVSNGEIERRSANGYTQFVPAGVNEGLLEAAGFRLIGREDRTDSVVLNASGRLKAMHAHRSEIEAADGIDAFGEATTVYRNRGRAVAAKGLVAIHVHR